MRFVPGQPVQLAVLLQFLCLPLAFSFEDTVEKIILVGIAESRVVRRRRVHPLTPKVQAPSERGSRGPRVDEDKETLAASYRHTTTTPATTALIFATYNPQPLSNTHPPPPLSLSLGSQAPPTRLTSEGRGNESNERVAAREIILSRTPCYVHIHGFYPV